MEDKKSEIKHLVIRLLSEGNDNTEKLWYDKPANIWLEALPIGNGSLGGMIFGGTKSAQIQLNEDTFWAGGPHNNNSSSSKNYLERVRELIFKGQETDAEKIINNEFIKGPHGMKYLSLGSLYITHSQIDGSKTRNYKRELDLKTALSTITFESDGVNYKRTTFASIPDKVIIIKLEAGKRSSFTITHGAPFFTTYSESQGGIAAKIQGVDHEGIKSQLAAELLYKVVDTDGMVNNKDKGEIDVSNYTSAIIVITAATNYVNYNDVKGDPSLINTVKLSKVEKMDYDTLLNNHLESYQKQYNRVHLNLPSDEKISQYTTEKRLNSFTGSEDWGMVALLFNYGRYLLISSSQPGCQPANLQGLWNDKKDAPWDSKYTININAEMNYWPAETCNIS